MLQRIETQSIQKAVMIIHRMSDDEKIQGLARLREKALHDEASALSTARKEGRAEGLAVGRDERGEELVKSMHENGIPEEQIRKIISR